MFKTNELEKIFSADNDSLIFPILAHCYYEKKLYKYAVKICRIGLNESPNNLEGLYILAKSLLMSGQSADAARLLKKILKQFPYHLQSTLLLIHILEETNKNQLIIQSYIRKIFYFYPDHPQVKSFYKKYCSNLSPKREKPYKKKSAINAKKTFSYNPKLATVTMYKLLYSQNKFHDALAILTILSESDSHKDFVDKELKKIKQKLKKG